MKLKLFVTTLTLMSAVAYAEVDYSRCTGASGMWGVSLDSEGKLASNPYQKIVNKTTEGKIEKYDIENEYPDYKGGIIKSKTQVTLERDDQGRVVKMQTGGDKLDKKNLEMMKKFQLQGQVSMAMMSAGSYGTAMGEPTYYVKDKDNKSTFKKLSDLSKEERSQVNISEEAFKEMKQKAKQEKKSASKIEKGLKEIQDKSFPVYYLGQESEFEITDGVCKPKSVSQRMINTKDNSIVKNKVFSKESCEEVQKLYVKHKEQISKCESSNALVAKDLYQEHEKIKDVMGGQYSMGGYPGGGMGGGYVGGMYGGGMVGGMGGGFGGYGPQSNTLTYLKNYCDMMVGEMRFGYGFETNQKPATDSSKQ